MTLVADIGKVPLLAELSREMRRASLRPNDISPALVGGVFHQFHERAGSLLAKAWHMSDEFISVAGCHHAYNRNEQNRVERVHGQNLLLIQSRA